MDAIRCKNCRNHVTPKSGKCPQCGYQFTLRDIIPDHEVEEYKEKTMSQMKTLLFICGCISIPACINGGFWTVFAVIFGIPFIIGLLQYISYSNQDIESWRVQLSKTWKYKSGLEKAGFILKVISGASKF